MVNLTRIYTRTGDKGTTALGDMSRTAKTDLRIAAYADANEANACIGTAIALGQLPERGRQGPRPRPERPLRRGRRPVHPVVGEPGVPAAARRAAYIDKLETDCDHFLEQVEKLRSFILPGGTPGAALLHQACTVVRRAERSTWAAFEVHGETMNPLTATYLNRLSDLLFILARVANKEVGDVLWVPGGDR